MDKLKRKFKKQPRKSTATIPANAIHDTKLPTHINLVEQNEIAEAGREENQEDHNAQEDLELEAVMTEGENSIFEINKTVSSLLENMDRENKEAEQTTISNSPTAAKKTEDQQLQNMQELIEIFEKQKKEYEKDEIEELEAEVEYLKKENEKLRSEKATQAAENKKLQDKNSKLEEKNGSLEAELESLKEENAKLVGEKVIQATENKELQDKNSTLEEKNGSLETELESLKGKNAKLTEEKATQAAKNKELQDKNTKLEEKNGSLEAELESLKGKNAKLTEEKVIQAAENKELRDKNSKLEEKNESLEAELESLKEENAKVTRNIKLCVAGTTLAAFTILCVARPEIVHKGFEFSRTSLTSLANVRIPLAPQFASGVFAKLTMDKAQVSQSVKHFPNSVSNLKSAVVDFISKTGFSSTSLTNSATHAYQFISDIAKLTMDKAPVLQTVKNLPNSVSNLRTAAADFISKATSSYWRQTTAVTSVANMAGGASQLG
jgi:myosin heavy subunit